LPITLKYHFVSLKLLLWPESEDFGKKLMFYILGKFVVENNWMLFGSLITDYLFHTPTISKYWLVWVKLRTLQNVGCVLQTLQNRQNV
jgi:hypothetical protein